MGLLERETWEGRKKDEEIARLRELLDEKDALLAQDPVRKRK